MVRNVRARLKVGGLNHRWCKCAFFVKKFVARHYRASVLREERETILDGFNKVTQDRKIQKEYLANNLQTTSTIESLDSIWPRLRLWATMTLSRIGWFRFLPMTTIARSVSVMGIPHKTVLHLTCQKLCLMLTFSMRTHILRFLEAGKIVFLGHTC